MRFTIEEWKSHQNELGLIVLLVILLSTNLGNSPPLRSNRSFRLVMYVLGLR